MPSSLRPTISDLYLIILLSYSSSYHILSVRFSVCYHSCPHSTLHPPISSWKPITLLFSSLIPLFTRHSYLSYHRPPSHLQTPSALMEWTLVADNANLDDDCSDLV